jgi:hypothetical protein
MHEKRLVSTHRPHTGILKAAQDKTEFQVTMGKPATGWRWRQPNLGKRFSYAIAGQERKVARTRLGAPAACRMMHLPVRLACRLARTPCPDESQRCIQTNRADKHGLLDDPSCLPLSNFELEHHFLGARLPLNVLVCDMQIRVIQFDRESWRFPAWRQVFASLDYVHT